MKFRYILALFVAGLLTAMSLDTRVLGQNSSVNTVDKWRYTGGYVQVASSTAKLSIPGLASSDECIKTDATGKTYTGTCGSGGSLSGGSANTLTYWTSGTEVGATSSPTVGYITATSTTGTSSLFGYLNIGKDLGVSTDGSTEASPRVFGLTNLSGGEAARFQFGDEHNALQNSYAKDQNLYSYWALVLTGGRQNFSTNFQGMPFSKTTNVGVLVKSDSYVGNDPSTAGTPIDTLGIMATTSQWTNLTSWRDPNGATMSLVDYLGHFSLGSSATSSAVLNVVGNTNLLGTVNMGTVASGTWNGTALTDAYVDDTITASNYLSLTSWYGTTTHSLMGSLPGLVTIGSSSATTTASGYLAASAFGIIGKFFADATRFIVSVAAQFTQRVTFSGAVEFFSTFAVGTSTDPTMTNANNLSINTTAASSSLRYYDGTAERVLSPIVERSFSFASSTLTYMGAYGAAGTTTILLSNYDRPVTLTDIYCKTNIGTTSIQFTDGTNATDLVMCGPNGAEDDGTIANNTWVRREDFEINIGSSIGTPSNITVTAGIRSDAD